MPSTKAKTICIVTPDYISCTPRVVKEADAFLQAGYDVRVVFSQGNLENLREFDKLLLKEKPWRWAAFGWSPFRKNEKSLYYKSKIRYHLINKLPSIFWLFGKVAECGEGRIYKELTRLAVSEKADIYIGHYPTGLAAAAYAAFCWKAKLGYDIEDLHTEEGPLDKKGIRQRKRIKIIERRYLPHCSHITAVSDLIAGEIAKRYNVTRPIAIHNVFPWGERAKIDGQIKDRKETALSLYWYSKVIGDDRGVQDAIRAAALLKKRAQMHLRGYISEGTKNKLLRLAQEYGVEKNIYFHPQIPPTELLSRAAEHDVGLALEQPINLSRAFSITNKFFFYLLAGLAIVATDTPGQRYVMSTCQEAGFFYPPGDYQTLAEHLNKFILEPNLLRSSKQAALRAAQEKWNWEIESKKLVANIDSILK